MATGPFKVIEFKRDAYLKFEKFEDYWRPDMPYLDGIDIRFIPEEVTAAASLEAGEIDYWQGPGTKRTVLDLQEKGFKAEVSGLFLQILVPSANNPDSPFADKKVREAIGYAIDREALTQALTLGLGEPAYQAAPSTAAVYDPDYEGRQYDPEKARQLLAEAGYSDGLQTSLFSLAFGDIMVTTTAIQGYLGEVGIEAKVEACDMGRFMVLEEEGWDGLMLNIVMVDSPNYAIPFLDNFGPPPTKYYFASFGRSPEYEALCEQVKLAQDDESERAIVQKMIRQVGEEATVIPLFGNPPTPMMPPSVHPYIDEETGWMRFFYHEMWMEQQ